MNAAGVDGRTDGPKEERTKSPKAMRSSSQGLALDWVPPKLPQRQLTYTIHMTNFCLNFANTILAYHNLRQSAAQRKV
jgi:hypothetical protein